MANVLAEDMLVIGSVEGLRFFGSSIIKPLKGMRFVPQTLGVHPAPKTLETGAGVVKGVRA